MNPLTQEIIGQILGIIATIITFLSYQMNTKKTLLIIFALAANTIFMSFGNPQLLRKSILLTSTCVLIYNVFVFSIGGIANEGISIISSVIGIIRFRKEKNNNTVKCTT